MSKPVVPTRRLRQMPIPAALMVATLVLIPSAGTANEAAAQAISVEGNHRIDADTVRSYFHPAADGRFDAASLDVALKALIATGLFEHVAVDHAGERLVVRLTEAKVLDRVAFEGNKKIKDKELEAVVESKPRGTLQRAMVQADVGRIMEAYRHAGRDDVGVVPEIIDRGNDRVDLVYEVTEGSKTTVRQINFVGNQVFSKRQLAAVIKTSATNMLSFLTGGDAYDPDRIAADRELLRRYYRSKGYADASVPSAVAEYDPATRGFTLTFSIDEGPLYHFGDIGVDCRVVGLDSGQLRRLLLIRTGAVFDGNALDKSTEIVGTALAKLGYPFAQATTRTTRDADARRIGVALVIDQGPRTYVERIEIHGNTRTRGYVIRREFDIAEGDAYNKALIDRAERRLKNLNYFKTVKISNKPGSAPDRVILDVEVAEQSTGDFSISGGYSTTDGLLAEVKLGDSNFLGSGAAVKTSLTYGQYARGVDLSASEPYFLGTRVAAGIEFLAKQTDASSYQSYGSDVYGATLSLGTPIDRTGRRAMALLAVPPKCHARPGVAGRSPLAAHPAGGACRPGLGFRRRRYRQLQHARQYQESDQRHQFATQAGSGRPRRRREFPAHHRGRALLSVAQQRPRRHGPRPGRLHHGLWRPAGAADRQLFRRPATGAGICAQRLRASRSHPRHHHG